MGAGSSKVDWHAPKQKRKENLAPVPHLPPKPKKSATVPPPPPTGIPTVRRRQTYGVQEPFIPPPLQRTQSARRPTPSDAGVRERRDALHRAFASESGVPQYFIDPSQTLPSRALPPPLRNPLPLPPKDLLSGSDFSRVPFASPPPFVPVQNDELKRTRTKGKARETILPEREVFMQQGEPSSSFSSHSSASTTHPPPQVLPHPMGIIYPLQQSQSHHEPPPQPQDKPKSKTSRLLSSFMSTVRSPNKEAHPRLSLDPNGPSPISQPYVLAPRHPPPPPPQPFFFYHPDEPGFGFTTFSPHKILYKRQLYPTAEHLYQAMKFMPSKGRGDAELAEQVRTYSDRPEEAVVIARQFVKRARPDWKDMRVVWMDEIMYMKFVQHPDLRRELISTIPAELVFVSPVDRFWGTGEDGHGANELGRCLSRVRSRILHEMSQ